MKDFKVLVVDLKEINFDAILVSDECKSNIQFKTEKAIENAKAKAENIGDSSTDLRSLGIEMANLKCLQEINIDD